MSLSVLIVDDSPILRRAIRKAVGIAGIATDRIREAGNGVEALASLERDPADLVLLDLNMPVMDGERFAAELRNRPDVARGARIIVVSTEVNRERLDRLRGLGAMAILHKPFEPEELRRLVMQLTGESVCAA